MIERISFSQLVELSCSKNIDKVALEIVRANQKYFFKYYNFEIKKLIYRLIMDEMDNDYSIAYKKKRRTIVLDKINDYFTKFGYSRSEDSIELLKRLYYSDDILTNKAINAKVNMAYKGIIMERKRYWTSKEKEQIKLNILSMNIDRISKSLFIRKLKINNSSE